MNPFGMINPQTGLLGLIGPRLGAAGMQQMQWDQYAQSMAAQQQQQMSKYARLDALSEAFGLPPEPKPKPEPKSCYPESWYHRNVWGLKP